MCNTILYYLYKRKVYFQEITFCMNAIEHNTDWKPWEEKTMYRMILSCSSRGNSSIILIYDLRHILCLRVI